MSHITRKYKNYDPILPTKPETECKQGDGGFIISEELNEEMIKECTRTVSTIRQLAKYKNGGESCHQE